ncbi:MAG: capsular polysaccharide biosynthesis protein [Pirellulaceae bacterium]|jgi:capsular polysaccharide biosynthesis protein
MSNPQSSHANRASGDEAVYRPGRLYAMIVTALALFLLGMVFTSKPVQGYRSVVTIGCAPREESQILARANLQDLPVQVELKSESLTAVMVSDPLLHRVLTALDSQSIPQTTTSGALEADIRLRTTIQVIRPAPGAEQLITITYMDRNPHASVGVANGIAQQFLASKIEIDGYGYTQLKTYRAQLQGGRPAPSSVIFLSLFALTFGAVAGWLAGPEKEVTTFASVGEVANRLSLPIIGEIGKAVSRRARRGFLSRARLASFATRTSELTLAILVVGFVSIAVMDSPYAPTFLQDPLTAISQVVSRIRGT